MGALHRRRFRKFRLPGLTRRSFLKGSAAALALPLLDACGNSEPPVGGIPATPGPVVNTPTDTPTPVAPNSADFLHGVASGDPLTDRVILWTRITPDLPVTAIQVDYRMSLTSDLGEVVKSGSFVTTGARDYTVKVDPTGLASYTTYYYQFSVRLADGQVVKSVIGRTKTAPKAGEADRLRFVSASCQNLTYGYFNAHAAIALKPDIDAMLFLGDYIYETAATSQLSGRDHDPAKEITTLADYRQRHSQYKKDADLQACHRQIPWICVWDDHETTDNSYSTGANNHTEATDTAPNEGIWKIREGWAVRAYFEWMPIRDTADMRFDSPNGEGLLPEGHGKIQRVLSYGDLVDLIMLDTRLAGRVEQTDTATVSEDHTLLGKPQREWFLGELSRSKAKWKIIGQQVNFAPLKVVPLPEAQGGTFLNSDAWDGYRFDRNAVMQHIATNNINNIVFLSGDIHSVIAMDLPVEPSDPTQYNPLTGAGSLAVEYCCNGVANVGVIGEELMANNPHMKYANLLERGYLLLDVTSERVQGEYFFTLDPKIRSAVETFQRALINSDGTNHLVLGTTATTGRGDAAPLAP